MASAERILWLGLEGEFKEDSMGAMQEGRCQSFSKSIGATFIIHQYVAGDIASVRQSPVASSPYRSVVCRSQSFEQSARQQRHYQTALGSQETQVEVTTQKKFNQTTALLLGLSLEQRQLFQSLIESNRQLVSANERMAYELGQMRSVVQLQMEIPPQVHLQKPVIFLDACGKVSAFYLDFITCSEALLAVLKIRFQQHGVRERGLKMLDDSQFILEDHRGTLDLSKDWSQVLRPNQKINMSMVFHRDIPCSVCPACRSVNDNALALSIEW